MKNVIIFGKYKARDVILRLLTKAEGIADQNDVRIIIKDGDAVVDSSLVVRHRRNMKGDVCDALWEVAKMSKNCPLVLASSKGFLAANDLSADADNLRILCDEVAYADFKFDYEGNLIECRDLSDQTCFVLIFRNTLDFIEMSKEIILSNKTGSDGRFDLYTLINQAILLGVKIDVERFEI